MVDPRSLGTRSAGLLIGFGLFPWDVPPALAIVNIGIWPIIMGLTMFLQQKLNPQPADPMQQKIFMILPIVFTFLLGGFPAGLVIYWAWNNTLSIGQQWLIMRQMGVSASGETINAEPPKRRHAGTKRKMPQRQPRAVNRPPAGFCSKRNESKGENKAKGKTRRQRKNAAELDRRSPVMNDDPDALKLSAKLLERGRWLFAQDCAYSSPAPPTIAACQNPIYQKLHLSGGQMWASQASLMH